MSIRIEISYECRRNKCLRFCAFVGFKGNWYFTCTFYTVYVFYLVTPVIPFTTCF